MSRGSAAGYRTLLGVVFGGPRLEEDESLDSLAAMPSEIELQSRWFAGDFGRVFQSVAGQRIEVIQFGEWNRGAGPDFREVVISAGGKLLRGAVEIDTDVRDWERHGHAQNAAYDDVVLHVWFEAPTGESFFTRTSSHRQVMQMRLDLAALARRHGPMDVATARCGRCSHPLRDLPAERINSLFEGAARHRIEQKARRLARIAELHGWDQALFQETAAAFGYQRNKLPMTILAQRLPLRYLHGHRAGAEALLFGVAGFLEIKIQEPAGAATREYLRNLWQSWWKYRHEFAGRLPLRWTLSGSRPVNHPQRRLGALAVVVDHWKRLRAAFDRGPDAVARALGAIRHPYWENHYTLTSAPAVRPMALVGDSRITDILANLAFPYISLRRPDWWPHFARLPAVLENDRSRRAAIRLLGRRPEARQFTSKLFQQQALIQIYEDFCLRDDSDCANCLFPEQLAEWEGEKDQPPHV